MPRLPRAIACAVPLLVLLTGCNRHESPPPKPVASPVGIHTGLIAIDEEAAERLRRGPVPKSMADFAEGSMWVLDVPYTKGTGENERLYTRPCFLWRDANHSTSLACPTQHDDLEESGPNLAHLLGVSSPDLQDDSDLQDGPDEADGKEYWHR